ncbi:hypothetical protein SEA_SCARLETT_1 [Mycobacterium phage Scarlett]|nr:hypothetical protein SEA_SCARLETT_1 [Mycobacterium phage Scarlett]
MRSLQQRVADAEQRITDKTLAADKVLDAEARDSDRQMRLACSQLAVRMHEDSIGLGDDVLATARKLAAFVDGTEAQPAPGGPIYSFAIGERPSC